MNKFKTLCNLLEDMKNPKEARDQIADYIKELSPEDQIIACNFMLGSPLENDAVGYSKRTVQKVIDTYYDYDKSKKYATLGDMFFGELDINNNNVSILLKDIYAFFISLSVDGKNKEVRLHDFLIMMDDLEKKYFINILLNKLRVRIGMGVLSHSLEYIYGVDYKYINNLYKKYESMTDVINILNAGIDEIQIGKPVKPQLAKDISKYMDRIQYPVLAEPKFDGSRAQVHVHEDGTVQIFSRSLKDKTDSFPDVVELLKENNIQSGIFDGEIYGVNPDGSLMSFNKYQHRINNIKSVNVDEYPVTIRLFDILMLGSEDMTMLSQEDRTQTLINVCGNLSGGRLYINNEEELIEYHKECVRACYEGVMVKNISGTYDCGRGKSEWNNWFKLKTELRFDCLITGARRGEGDKFDVLASFDISVLESTSESAEIGFKSVGSCGGGFTMEELKDLTERIGDPDTYDYVGNPIIVEIKTEKVMRDKNGNFGFRFPQYMGFRDKAITDIDSVEMVSQYI